MANRGSDVVDATIADDGAFETLMGFGEGPVAFSAGDAGVDFEVPVGLVQFLGDSLKSSHILAVETLGVCDEDGEDEEEEEGGGERRRHWRFLVCERRKKKKKKKLGY